MFLDDYYSEENGRISISAAQASRFAKGVAGDYNPIHDEGARRFCVPGDLLFTLMLSRFGLYENMSFRFNSMVGAGTLLDFQQPAPDRILVADDAQRSCIEATCSGRVTRDEAAIESFTRSYVAFSGSNFPHYLKPLMEEKGVMFHPQRPLVIYDSMDFELEQLADASTQLSYEGSRMDVDGKRADVRLEFRMTSDGTTIGRGSKKLVISGLRPYDPEIMKDVIAQFNALKKAFQDSEVG